MAPERSVLLEKMRIPVFGAVAREGRRSHRPCAASKLRGCKCGSSTDRRSGVSRPPLKSSGPWALARDVAGTWTGGLAALSTASSTGQSVEVDVNDARSLTTCLQTARTPHRAGRSVIAGSRHRALS